jgi:hypothetical protein
MAKAKPDAALVRRAIDVYVGVVYPDGPPVTVRSMLAVLRSFAGDFLETPTFIRDGNDPPRKYSLRLGNRVYPHMKLVCELSPDAKQFLFRADAHDVHCCPPPDSPEYAPFRQLMETNQQVVTEVEKAWADEGIPTLKTYLLDDLAKRKSDARPA